jgi:WD40 repeat protein
LPGFTNRQCLFSPAGDWLAFGSSIPYRHKGSVTLIHPRTGESLGVLADVPSPVSCLAASADGGHLVVGCLNGVVQVWSPREQRLLLQVEGPKSPVVGLVVPAEDTLVAAWSSPAGRPPEIRRLRLRDGERLPDLPLPLAGVTALAAGAGGKLLAAGGADGSAYLWDLSGGKLREPLPGPGGSIRALAFSPDGRTLALSGANAQEIRLVDVVTRKSVGALRGAGRPCTALAFHPRGLLAAGGDDLTLRLWDVAKREPVGAAPWVGTPCRSLSFHPDGSLLAHGHEAGPGTVWRVETLLPAR